MCRKKLWLPRAGGGSLFRTFAGYNVIIGKMRTFLLAALLLCGSASAAAQGREVKTFELEPFVGATAGLHSPGSMTMGPAIGLEGRWNLASRPVDIGAQLYTGSACSTYRHDDISCRIASLGAFADWNFRRGESVSPFVGVGLSANAYDMVNGDYHDGEGDGTWGVGVNPRVGVELFRHLRLTLTARIGRNIYNQASLTIGYAFGGGLKSR